MTIKNLSLSLLFVTLSLSAKNTQAQTATPTVWKKTVTRTLDISRPEDEKKHHLNDVNADNTLVEALLNDVKAGKLIAYSTWDNTFSTKLSIKDIKEMTAGKTDTMTVVDPINKEEKSIVRVTEFNPDVIHKYRLLEEWTFNPQTGKTEIQITGIAPIKEVYGDDGVFRGVQAMFWLKYTEAMHTISKYEQYHPENTIAKLIWNDYFLSDVKPAATK